MSIAPEVLEARGRQLGVAYFGIEWVGKWHEHRAIIWT
jgi:hypothetical protein